MAFEETQQYVPEWEEALQRCAAVPSRVMVMGMPDVGKTTLINLLAERILQHQSELAVLDLDLGQSEVGPPTTMGLGLLDRVAHQVGYAKPLGMGFVGALTPGGMGIETIQALLPLLPLIPQNMSCLIDGHGLVVGGVARRLWMSYYEALRPDIILAIQSSGELEPILKTLDRRPVRIVRLPRPNSVGNKSREFRSERRSRRLSRHLAAMKRVYIDWSEVSIDGSWLFSGTALSHDQTNELSELLGLHVVWAERVDSKIYAMISEREADRSPLRVQGSWGGCDIKISCQHYFSQLICGLIGSDGICRSLAVCEKIDFQNKRLQLMSSYQQFQEICVLRLGRLFVDSSGVPGSSAPLGEYY
ncbi:MAG: Clp1/GlmU family protein [Armatimonadota bacterium]